MLVRTLGYGTNIDSMIIWYAAGFLDLESEKYIVKRNKSKNDKTWLFNVYVSNFVDILILLNICSVDCVLQ